MLSLLALAGLMAEPAALEIHAPNAGHLYAYPANPRRGQSDVMIQTLVLEANAPLEIAAIHVDYLVDGEVRASRRVDLERAQATTGEMAGMAAAGADVFLKAQVLDEAGIEAVVGNAVTLNPSPQMESGNVLLASGIFQTVDFAVDEVSIRARYHHEGQGGEASLLIPVVPAASAIDYSFPLEGSWMMRGLPSAQGHHRWIPSNEFAVDLFKVGEAGSHRSGDSVIAENNYGYGAPVLAAADGEVVAVISDAVQDRSVFTIREGESRAEAGRRIQQYNQRRIMTDFRSALAGNLITIRHQAEDGTVEYSNYGHLKAGSVSVEVGQQVQRGQRIAEVGDTGDSDLVHLHFQVNAGADPFFSPSIPVHFSNIRQQYGGQEPGIFVSPRD